MAKTFEWAISDCTQGSANVGWPCLELKLTTQQSGLIKLAKPTKKTLLSSTLGPLYHPAMRHLWADLSHTPLLPPSSQDFSGQISLRLLYHPAIILFRVDLSHALLPCTQHPRLFWADHSQTPLPPSTQDFSGQVSLGPLFYRWQHEHSRHFWADLSQTLLPPSSQYFSGQISLRPHYHPAIILFRVDLSHAPLPPSTRDFSGQITLRPLSHPATQDFSGQVFLGLLFYHEHSRHFWADLSRTPLPPSTGQVSGNHWFYNCNITTYIV
jgi:hypothetical protein